ncbi:hypothetical protein GCM10010347_25910 [Streptomyces cirratus]|uniref:Uncharacterized protein n=1 Tax=Streptomyces cirratus TaxID=68187 RepID=A0ABQ3EVY5_9ACTN|nr:hypothetical protein GCM10010347_25910 [Streptomyces cirratus]
MFVLACPWAHRAVIVRRLPGLEQALPVAVAGPTHDKRSRTFDLDPSGRDPVTEWRGRGGRPFGYRRGGWAGPRPPSADARPPPGKGYGLVAGAAREGGRSAGGSSVPPSVLGRRPLQGAGTQDPADEVRQLRTHPFPRSAYLSGQVLHEVGPGRGEQGTGYPPVSAPIFRLRGGSPPPRC